MKIKKVELPKVYHNEHGNYPEFEGRPKISYSQYTSFIDPLYKGSYIANYFMGIQDEGNIFSSYGSAIGTVLEYMGQNNIEGLKEAIKKGEEPNHFTLLSDVDMDILKEVDLPDNSKYEYEICIDMLPITGVDFVIQGFIDRATFQKDNSVDVIDYKTGNIIKKVDFYAGDDYWQTRIYAYALEQLGYTINYCGVELLSRKGNGSEKYPLRLEGKTEHIETPYVKEVVETKLKEIAKVALEISSMYKTYKKVFKK